MFEDLGFRYIGPIDGHNIEQLCTALEAAKSMNIPVVLHINTVKGKGFEQAEKSPDVFHGISRFDPVTGDPPVSGKNFSSAFGDFMVQAAAKDKRICAVTAAMAVGTGLNEFSTVYPDRFFDAGIAEEHAATFCSGLSKGGMLPVFAVYSSFLQRSYDQIIHDAAMQKLNMVFAVDRAGFVGEDGMSHQGIFDAAFLNTIPDITVYSPTSYKELNNCLVNAFYHSGSVTVVRYPRGQEPVLPEDFELSFGAYDYYGDENADVLLVTYGRIFANAALAVRQLSKKISCAVLKLNRIKPIDKEAVEIAAAKKYVIFFEEGQKHGGINETFAMKLLDLDFKGVYRSVAVEDEFPIHDTVQAQLNRYCLDTNGMIKTVQEVTACG